MPPIRARLVRWEYSLRTPRVPASYLYIDLIYRDEAGSEYHYHIPDRRETVGRRLREFWAAYGIESDGTHDLMTDVSDAIARGGELHIFDAPVLIRFSDARWYHRITSLRPLKQEAA